MFNEKVHAHIAVRFYQLLKENFEFRGVLAFNHATQYYAGQRGRRMAQRVIRDNKKLTYENYCQYGEWINTDFTINEGTANKSIINQISPHYEREVFVCPWHSEFKESNEIEGGHEYCKYLDECIAKGFNPDIKYRMLKTLHKDTSCIHFIEDAEIDSQSILTKDGTHLLDFEYHCAHSFWSYAEISESIFKFEGLKISLQVLNDLKYKYGEGVSEIILKYKNMNFNTI